MKIAYFRRLDYRILIVDDQGKTWIYWDLSAKQMDHIGEKINYLTCYKIQDLCDLHLKRPHLTCLTCELRKVVQGSKPPLYQIHIHQLLIEKTPGPKRNLLTKNLISIVEFLTKI